MPIRADHLWLYPIDWTQLSRSIRFGRAGGRCEHCRRPHGEQVFHLGGGLWWDRRDGRWRDGQGRRVRLPCRDLLARDLLAEGRWTRVVLACAHLNHDPTDSVAQNLAALCQRCHMLHDGPEHRRRRWQNRHYPRALGDLFHGPYPRLGATTIVPVGGWGARGYS